MDKIKRRFLILAGCAVIALAVGWFWLKWESGSQLTGPGQGEAARRKAPEFSLKTASGADVTLASLRGNVVIVHFWASWCPPCLEEIGHWVKSAETFAGKPVKFVGISLDEKWEDAWKLLPKEGLPPNVISLLDSEKRVADQFGSYNFPESYLLDKSGAIAMKLVGAQDWESPRMTETIDQVLAEK